MTEDDVCARLIEVAKDAIDDEARIMHEDEGHAPPCATVLVSVGLSLTQHAIAQFGGTREMRRLLWDRVIELAQGELAAETDG